VILDVGNRLEMSGELQASAAFLPARNIGTH